MFKPLAHFYPLRRLLVNARVVEEEMDRNRGGAIGGGGDENDKF
jgi:hypothetical protein